MTDEGPRLRAEPDDGLDDAGEPDARRRVSLLAATPTSGGRRGSGRGREADFRDLRATEGRAGADSGLALKTRRKVSHLAATAPLRWATWERQGPRADSFRDLCATERPRERTPVLRSNAAQGEPSRCYGTLGGRRGSGRGREADSFRDLARPESARADSRSCAQTQSFRPCASGRPSKFLQRVVLDLADALARDARRAPDLLERACEPSSP